MQVTIEVHERTRLAIVNGVDGRESEARIVREYKPVDGREEELPRWPK